MVSITHSIESLMALIREAMDDVFGEDVYLKKEEDYKGEGLAPMRGDGYFRMEYLYRPLRYSIIWKGTVADFKIKLRDESGAFCHIASEEPRDIMVTDRDIRKLAKRVKRAIEDGPRFYAFRMGRLYRRVDGRWKKVRAGGGGDA